VSLPGIVAIVVVALSLVVAAYLRRWTWTGFVEPAAKRPPRKTLWDWLNLLIVPVVLAGVGLWFSDKQDQRDQDRQAAAARAQAARAKDDEREAVLRTYLQDMSSLLREDNLAASKPGSAPVVTARTLTLTVLRRLDGERRSVVVHFLDEAHVATPPKPKISLYRADLRDLRLRGQRIADLDFSGADLRRAEFRDASILSVLFNSADLRGADFRDSDLGGVDFSYTDLRHVDFRNAAVREEARFRSSCLTGTSFAGADVEGADFRDAIGHDIDLRDATLVATKTNTDKYARPRLWHVQRNSGSVLRGLPISTPVPGKDDAVCQGTRDISALINTAPPWAVLPIPAPD
jgi:uncharacterized protein YjbI with pentapeptide repeats